MRSIFVFSFITLSLLGCSSYYPFLIKKYDTKTTITSSIGSPMFQWGKGTRVLPNSMDKTPRYVFNDFEDLEHASGTLHEFIYKGILDSVASFVYREYVITPDVRYVSGVLYDAGTQATIKSSFNLDVQYDLRKSRIIAFQNFELRLERCDQQGISFEVISEPKEMHYTESLNNKSINDTNQTIQADVPKYYSKGMRRAVKITTTSNKEFNLILAGESPTTFYFLRDETDTTYTTIRRVFIDKIENR